MLLSVMIDPVRAASDGRHADADLESLLPTALGGVALTRESQNGIVLTRHSAPFDDFLASLGKQRSDFTVASAYAGDIAAEVGAWRVKGLGAEQLLPGFKIALQASSQTPLAFEDMTFGGRAVIRVGNKQQMARGPLYVVSHGDALLFVQTNDLKLAEEAIGKLPQ